MAERANSARVIEGHMRGASVSLEIGRFILGSRAEHDEPRLRLHQQRQLRRCAAEVQLDPFR